MRHDPTPFLLALGLLATAGTAHAKGSFDDTMARIADQYLIVSGALATDKTDGVPAAAATIGKLAATLDATGAPKEHAAHYAKVPVRLLAGAKQLAAAKDIAAMREALEALSRPVAMWAGMSGRDRYNVAYCSMAKGSWLQKGKVILNPYYGKSMLHCGELVSGPDAKAAPKPPAGR